MYVYSVYQTVPYQEGNLDRNGESSARQRGALCTEHEVCENNRISRRAVYGMDMGMCRIKGPGCLDFLPFRTMHIDHIIPFSRGGLHCWYNVQTSCPPCNQWKYDKIRGVYLCY